MFLSDYGLPGPSDGILPRLTPYGEKTGYLLRHFRIGDQICHLTKIIGGWPESRIVGIHGGQEGLISKLKDAGVLYLLVWREEHIREVTENGKEITPEMAIHFVGSGCMRSITLPEAETLAIDAYARKSDSTRRIFNLEHPFEVDSWSSNHPRFHSP